MRMAGPATTAGAGPSTTARRVPKETETMTAHTLPDELNYCCVPTYDLEDEVQQIRIVFEDMAGYVPTALVALDIDAAEQLNARLGLSKDDWTALAARSMRAETREPDDTTRH